MLSKKADYALRALLLLARNYGRGPVLISDLAEEEKIPKKFLELILLELRNQGFLQSKKGKGGGYSLRKPPEAITFGEVIRVIDGPLAPIPCVSERAYQKCELRNNEATCAVRIVMKQVRNAIARILDNITLADALKLVENVENTVKEERETSTYYM